jgi:voltage-gated potassium channel
VFFYDIQNMIHPESRFREYWDFFVFFVTIFGALIMPLSIVFDFSGRFIFVLSRWFFPLVFITDIAVNFRTAVIREGKLIKDSSYVAEEYLRGWFATDLIAAVPTALFLSLFPAAGLFNLFKLNVLFKLPKVGKTLRRIGGIRINPAILRLFMLVFWILLAAHVISCGWILISGNQEGLDPFSLYIKAFYWTITTLTTIGYGDITPDGNAQIIFVVFIELIGAAMYGLIIGNIANLIANIDVAKTQYKEKLEKINTFLKYRDIPFSLQKKINNYYNYLWESRRGYDESSVLDELPDPLKVSVSLYINKEIIEKVPIFEHASEDLIKDIILNLEPVVFTPGDHIVRAGELGFEMFFISKGSVEVTSADERIVYATLTDGQFFGEIALLLSMPRTATIKAKEYCDLYRLNKETFERVINRYPEFAESIQELAEKRRAEIGEVQQRSAAEKKEQEKEKKKEEADGKPEEELPVSKRVETIRARVTQDSIILKWNEVEDLGHYEIQKRNPDTGRWELLDEGILQPEYTDRLPAGVKRVSYRIRAVSIKGPGPWSKPSHITL